MTAKGQKKDPDSVARIETAIATGDGSELTAQDVATLGLALEVIGAVPAQTEAQVTEAQATVPAPVPAPKVDVNAHPDVIAQETAVKDALRSKETAQANVNARKGDVESVVTRVKELQVETGTLSARVTASATDVTKQRAEIAQVATGERARKRADAARAAVGTAEARADLSGHRAAIAHVRADAADARAAVSRARVDVVAAHADVMAARADLADVVARVRR